MIGDAETSDAGDAAVVRADDPAVPGLLGDGWTVVSESWGARLDLTDGRLDQARATCAAARRRGLATAVKAAAVLDLSAAGHGLFGTGGAGRNVVSRRANEALGYVVAERFLHLSPPR